MTVDELNAVQQAAQQQWGVGKVKFAETLLHTDYDTFCRWTGPRGAKMPGAVKTACAFIQYALGQGWTLEQFEEAGK